MCAYACARRGCWSMPFCRKERFATNWFVNSFLYQNKRPCTYFFSTDGSFFSKVTGCFSKVTGRFSKVTGCFSKVTGRFSKSDGSFRLKGGQACFCIGTISD